MKKLIKLVALALVGACIPVYAYVTGCSDATDERTETVTYPDGTTVTTINGGADAEDEGQDFGEEEVF